MSRERSPADRLCTLLPPAPPPALRARTLAAAGPALCGRPEDRLEALYRSHPLRLAWLATVLLLVAAHVALSIGRRPASSEVADTAPSEPLEDWVDVSGAMTSSARSRDLSSIDEEVTAWASRFEEVRKEKLR